MRLLPLLLLLPLTATAKVPVLVELYTSDGCVNCPAADELLEKFARTQPVAGAEIIALEWHVDSFNTPEWKDPFTLPDARLRQNAFLAATDPHSMLYTPMLAVDGTDKTPGKEETEIRRLISAATKHKRLALSVSVAKGDVATLRFAPLPADASVHVAVTESHLTVAETSGPNASQVWKHGPVVQQHARLSELKPGARSATTPLMLPTGSPRTALDVVAWIENAKGQVLGVAKAAVPRRP